MTDDELRAWAEPRAASGPDFSGDRIAIGILRLLDENRDHVEINAALTIENAQLKLQLANFAERIHAQSELLSRKAEVPVCVIDATGPAMTEAYINLCAALGWAYDARSVHVSDLLRASQEVCRRANVPLEII